MLLEKSTGWRRKDAGEMYAGKTQGPEKRSGQRNVGPRNRGSVPRSHMAPRNAHCIPRNREDVPGDNGIVPNVESSQ